MLWWEEEVDMHDKKEAELSGSRGWLEALAYSFLLLLFIGCSQTQTPEPESADIALYNDKGTDKECVEATKNMFEWMGYTISLVDADFINTKRLDKFISLCVPGGDMYQYSQDISSAGKQKIRGFIAGGKAYIGICGGAYFAGEKVFWQGDQIPMESLELFAGTTKGPYDEIAPFPDYGMCQVNIVDTNHPIMQSESDSVWILYYWGPALIPDQDTTVAILGRYEKNDLPAILAFEYGSGRVFLIGPHPEIEEDSDRDNVTMADELDDHGSDWDLMRRATLWCLRKQS
jgi:glutamine amidotransferase-like uncharacterized protein